MHLSPRLVPDAGPEGPVADANTVGIMAVLVRD